jgi:8-oxo-dGTP pyrophosphatase MutT (NUDIX family)
MGFDDRFRMSVHAAVFDERGAVLLLKATYGDLGWGLPGGSIEPGETIHEALTRECREELGCEPTLGPLTGVYYHRHYGSQVFIFRAALAAGRAIALSSEHSEHRYFALDDLGAVQRRRVEDCLGYDGSVRSAKF